VQANPFAVGMLITKRPSCGSERAEFLRPAPTFSIAILALALWNVLDTAPEGRDVDYRANLTHFFISEGSAHTAKKMFSVNTLDVIRWHKAKWKSGANPAETQQRVDKNLKYRHIPRKPHCEEFQGLMTLRPAASNGLVSRVATIRPRAAAVAAMYPSALPMDLPACFARAISWA
jgi:hypothetical protein